MSTRAKTFATVAAIAAVVVAFGGTAQAQPAIATIPNYNFSQWDELTDYGALRDWNGPGGVGHYDHYTSVPDGMMTPYNTEGPQPASGYDEGYASNWYNATDPYSTELVVWNPTTTANAAPTYLTGYQYDATLSSPPPPEQRTPIGSNPVTAIGGPVTPQTINPGNPYIADPGPAAGIAAWHFNYSKVGNGVLPGTAAGSQCVVNVANLDKSTDELDGVMVPGVDTATYVNGVLTPSSVSSWGIGVASLADPTQGQHQRYTMTVALAVPLGSTYNAGNALMLFDMNTHAHYANDQLYPQGQSANGGWLGDGVFRDLSMSFSSDEAYATGDNFNAGDSIGVGFVACPGTCWSNYRFITQNWNPIYFSAAGSWNTSKWSLTSADDGQAASYTAAYQNVNASTPDAVFEKNGMGGNATVTVTSGVSANSLNFATDWTSGSYTLTTSNNSNITLSGDAVINVGSGTNQGWGPEGGGTNVGGGTATIDCVLAGSHGMYKTGAGTLYLTRSNIYTGGTTVGGGVLSVGNGGASGSIPGDVTNLAELDFNRSDTYTYTGTISGTGTVSMIGSGTTVFTANQAYTGLTSIPSGTLQIGNGGTSGNIAGDIVIGDLATIGATTHGTLAFNRSDTVTYGGYIYGTGNLVQKGSGTLVISDATTNATGYSGTMAVQAGKLQINQASPTMNVLTNGTSAGVNITGGGLILDYSNGGSDPATTVKSLLTTAYNGGVSAFQSGQLRDTSASTSVGLGWADALTINGHTHANQVVVVPALYGDANLDGVVDGYDLGILIGDYTHTGMTWSLGDSNYDGTVDGYDLGFLIGNYTKPGPVVLNVAGLNLDAAELSALRAAGITPMTDVPEPSSIIMLLAAAVWGGFAAIRRWRKRMA